MTDKKAGYEGTFPQVATTAPPANYIEDSFRMECDHYFRMKR